MHTVTSMQLRKAFALALRQIWPFEHLSLRVCRWLVPALFVSSLSGCAVVTVADAAVTVVATGVKVTAKTVGAVADAVIPDKDEE